MAARGLRGRENAVLLALAQGSTTDQAGKAAGVSGRTVRLDNTKQKNDAEFPPLLLRLVPFGDSAVLQSHHGVGLTDELARSEQAILAVMRDSFGTTGTSSSTLRDAVELPKSSFYRALNALVAKGLLRNVGTTKRPFYVLPGSEPSA